MELRNSSHISTHSGTGEGDRVVSFLRACSLFTDLDGATLGELAQDVRFETYDRRQTIPLQGALGVIGSGRVRLVQPRDGRELTMAYLGAGDILGELGLVSTMPLMLAVATERVEHLRLPLTRIEALVERSPAVASRLVRLLGARCLQAEGRIIALLTRTVESRVVDFLLSAAERHGVPDGRGRLIGVKFTHREIASYVGSTRETVTLTLGDLKRRGLIAVDHRRVVVLDEAGLRKLA